MDETREMWVRTENMYRAGWRNVFASAFDFEKFGQFWAPHSVRLHNGHPFDTVQLCWTGNHNSCLLLNRELK